MAKAKDIIAQLQAVLPRVTDLFSKGFAITSLTRSGTTVTAVTATPHNFETGNYINITGAQAPVIVSSITRMGNIATAITATPHDLTMGYQKTVKIVGANQAEYNGNTLPLLSVPNRNTFTYQISGTPVSPATGSILLFDGKERGYNGRYPITKIDNNTFTYQISDTPLSPAIGTIVARGQQRVSGAISLERAVQAYTKQNDNELWAFVVLTDTTTSKDRNVISDAVAIAGRGNDPRIMLIRRFSIFVFCPTTNEIAARAVSDLREDIEKALFKAIYRFTPSQSLTDQASNGVVFERSGLLHYEIAYAVLEFAFQSISYVTYDDTVDPGMNVAFRDIHLEMSKNPNAPVTAEINLDDKPE